MKPKLLLLLLWTAVLFTNCKNNTDNLNKKSASDNETSARDQSSTLINTTPLLDSLKITTDSVAVYNDEYDDADIFEFVYEEFDVAKVLDRLQLDELITNRSLKALLAAELREGDQLVQDFLETGDGTFDIYKLVDSYGNELAYFYYESNVITTIEIIHPGGVPDAMIRPGLTFEELRNTYENPIAYGSEIEARVFIHEGDVGFRMDTSYGIYEPIDLEDDTEILYIQF